MQVFIPFEDDWEALERLSPDSLVPYQVGMGDAPRHAPVEAVAPHVPPPPRGG